MDQTPQNTEKQMGRPRKVINWEQFEQLCSLQCTLSEIAGFFKVSEDTIERAVKRHYKQTFADVFRTKRGTGLISLRRSQFAAAQKGNPLMLIWLGKNWLGQKDKVDITSGDDKITGLDVVVHQAQQSPGSAT